jgi:outer membrane immunogenic protein
VTKRITLLFALTTFVLAVSGSAFAADIAVKAPPPAPAPVYNWTGWYAGVNAGASFGHVTTDFSVAPVRVTTLAGPAITTSGVAGSNTTYPGGFIGGGQIGYNWQYSPLIVVGLEADFQGALERDGNIVTSNFTGVAAPLSVTGSAVLDYQTKIQWFGTVRGRIGYVWGNGNLLSYVTGGLAYGRVDLEGTSTVSGGVSSGGPSTPFSISHAIGHSQVNTGWVVGYGTEGVINFWGARNWTWKIEGLYMDLGHLDDTDAIVGPTVTSVTGGQTFTHSHFTDGILRGGLNYKFY